MSALAFALASVAAGWLAFLLGRATRPRTPDSQPAAPSPPPRVSLYAQTISVRDVPRHWRRCGRCAYPILHEREGDECWMTVRPGADGKNVVRHYHRECADERGEPLPR